MEELKLLLKCLFEIVIGEYFVVKFLVRLRKRKNFTIFCQSTEMTVVALMALVTLVTLVALLSRYLSFGLLQIMNLNFVTSMIHSVSD